MSLKRYFYLGPYLKVDVEPKDLNLTEAEEDLVFDGLGENCQKYSVLIPNRNDVSYGGGTLSGEGEAVTTLINLNRESEVSEFKDATRSLEQRFKEESIGFEYGWGVVVGVF